MGYWDGKKVLVTGAGGFIGSHLSEQLVREGADVTAMVHYRGNGGRGWLDRSSLKDQIRMVAGDVTDPDLMTTECANQHTVFNLAALISIPYSYKAPHSFFYTNVDGAMNVARAAMASGSLLVQTSTSEVYGNSMYPQMDETHRIHPQSPYAASKAAADGLVKSLVDSQDLSAVIVRPFNTFGPRQSERAVIPSIIVQALLNQPIRLATIKPGELSRDFTFVHDQVRGFLLAAEHLAGDRKIAGEAFNFGSGAATDLFEIVDLVGAILKEKLIIIYDEERRRPEQSEVRRLCANSLKAQNVLGWQPEYTLPQGLKKTVDWFKEHLEDYRGEFAI